MILVLSPTKSLNPSTRLVNKASQVRFKKESALIIESLRKMTTAELMQLMKIKERLAMDVVHFLEKFNPSSYTSKNTSQAILKFSGAVYQGLDADSFSDEDLVYAQDHLRILSGLYGLLRPLDRIQDYRLEIGSKLAVNDAKNLYAFWGSKLTALLEKDLKKQKDNVIINLASNEYFKAIKTKELKARILTIDFREERDDQLKFITYNAKKARGLMARYIIQHRIERLEDIKGFLDEGYAISEDLSNDDKWLFVR